MLVLKTTVNAQHWIDRIFRGWYIKDFLKHCSLPLLPNNNYVVKLNKLTYEYWLRPQKHFTLFYSCADRNERISVSKYPLGFIFNI